MGTPRSMAGGTNDQLKQARLARIGMAPSRLGKLLRAAPMTLAEWGHALDINERTLMRLRDGREPLSRLYTDRIMQLARVIERGHEVFGSHERFAQWFVRPNPAIGGESPKQLIDTSFGTAVVEDELGRIEHGIFS